MCFPWLVVVIRSMGLTGGYEISFLGIIFTAVFAMLALIKYGYLDSVQQAVTNAIYKSNECLLVLDNDKNVLYYNSIIKRIFSNIAERRSANNVPVLCDTVEKCFDESGGINASGTPNTIETDDRIFEIKAEPILEAEYIQGYTFRAFEAPSITAALRSSEGQLILMHLRAFMTESFSSRKYPDIFPTAASALSLWQMLTISRQ